MGYSQTSVTISSDQGFVLSDDILFEDLTDRSTSGTREDYYRWLGTPSPYSQIRVTYQMRGNHGLAEGRMDFHYIDRTGTEQLIVSSGHFAPGDVNWHDFSHDVTAGIPWGTDVRLLRRLIYLIPPGAGLRIRNFRIRGTSTVCLIE